jgi:hypothetical protein
MNEQALEKHSTNCIGCNALVDERECIPGKDGVGDVCPNCRQYKLWG